MNAPIAESAVTRRHPPLDSDTFDALLACTNSICFR